MVPAGQLDLAGVLAVADGRARLLLQEPDRARIRHATQEADRIGAQRAIYGRTTGVGAQRTVHVENDQAQVRRLLTSHATTMGRVRSRRRTRAALTIRVAQCAGGHGGLRLAVVQELADALAEAREPRVHEGTAVGTGDLSVFAEVGVWLLTTNPGLLQPGDALPLISTNAATLADAALAVAELRTLCHAWLAVCALSARASRANPEAFSPAAAAAAPYRGIATACEVLTALWPAGRRPARIQDSYSLRTAPHILGLLIDELDYATFVIQQAIRTGSENPFYGFDTVTHHGGFYTNYLRAALRAVASACGDAARAGAARIAALGRAAVTGGTDFATDGAAGSSGTMPLEYLAAASAAAVAGWDAPYAALSVPLSANVEEFAPYTSQLAAAMVRSTGQLASVIAAELATAVRVLDAAADWPGWAELEPLRAGAADRVDRDLSDEVRRAADCLPALADRVERLLPDPPT